MALITMSPIAMLLLETAVNATIGRVLNSIEGKSDEEIQQMIKEEEERKAELLDKLRG